MDLVGKKVFHKRYGVEQIISTEGVCLEICYKGYGNKKRVFNNETEKEAFLKRLIEANSGKKFKQEVEAALKCKKTLTKEQCKAIFNDDDASLIIAGAGCGKTTTALGKIVYLVKSGKAKIEEILPIYFNRKNRMEMNDKITSIFGNTANIAHTYHSLGLKILGKSVNTKTTEEVVSDIFSDLFEQEHDDEFLKRIFEFISVYMYSSEDRKINYLPESFDRLSIEEKINIWANDCVTLRGDHVKSAAEAVIANYLFTHKIPYSYEKPFRFCYPDVTEQRIIPDFYIPLDNDPNTKNAIWIEHWGIEFDENGDEQVRWLNRKEAREYIEHKEDKKVIYKQRNVRLVELFLSEFKQETLIEKLQKKLDDFGVDTTKEMTTEEKVECLKNLIRKKRLSDFQNKVSICIGLLKMKEYSSQNLDKACEEACVDKKARDRRRIIAFYDVVKDIMKKYEECLAKEQAIDFTDMLLQALPKIDETDFPYKYIIIDEYQDIDELNYKLISKIQKKTGAKICCVGDDWQAIYRFKGADIRFFSEFSKYFQNPQKYKIQETFRNGAPLIDIAGNFVQKNPNQQRKKIRSDITTFLKATYYHEFEGDKNDLDRLHCLTNILRDKEKDNFLIILRNNNDLNKYFSYFGEGCDCVEKFEKRLQNKFSKKIDISTAHAAKGLEYDYVIIFNTAYRMTGFPSLMKDDPVIAFLLPKIEENEFPFAEERRLFYVALTRAKKGCYMLVPRFAPSMFFEEIKEEIKRKSKSKAISYSDNALWAVCPKCGGEMKKTKKNGRTFCVKCCSYLPRAFLIKEDKNIEKLIEDTMSNEEIKRPAAIFTDPNGDYHFERMQCTDIKNEASSESLMQEIYDENKDFYIILKNISSSSRFSEFKSYLIGKVRREPICLNFDEPDLYGY